MHFCIYLFIYFTFFSFCWHPQLSALIPPGRGGRICTITLRWHCEPHIKISFWQDVFVFFWLLIHFYFKPQHSKMNSCLLSGLLGLSGNLFNKGSVFSLFWNTAATGTYLFDWIA